MAAYSDDSRATAIRQEISAMKAAMETLRKHPLAHYGLTADVVNMVRARASGDALTSFDATVQTATDEANSLVTALQRAIAAAEVTLSELTL